MRAPSSAPSRASNTADSGSWNSGRGSIAQNATPPATSSAAAMLKRLARHHLRPAAGGAGMCGGIVHGLRHDSGQIVASPVRGVDACLEVDGGARRKVAELHHPILADIHMVSARGPLVAELLALILRIALTGAVTGIEQPLIGDLPARGDDVRQRDVT